VWSGTEQQRIEEVLRAFEQQSGATVTYTAAGHRMADALAERKAANRLPDVAFVPQPGLVRQYAREGLLAPADGGVTAEVARSYGLVWRDLAAVDGTLYAVWFKAANKSLVWYDVAAFEQAGLVPPQDLNGFLSIASTMSASGTPAFALGAADGWTLTDWFENVYLRVAGTDSYDRLADRRLPWTDDSVKQALRILVDLWAPRSVAGGSAHALQTGFEASVLQAFSRPASAAMVVEGDFVQGLLTAKALGRPGIDIDVFAFPPHTAGVPTVVGGGDAAVILHDSPAAQALLEFLASPEAAAIWASHGGYVSPNLNLDLSVYPDDTSRSVARQLLEAGDGFRFDLSDLQPAAFGGIEGDGMRSDLQLLLATSDVDLVASRLEAHARAAYGD
jgi:ABC-type glycerol-3-phosphate transport system substrate-binding protein